MKNTCCVKCENCKSPKIFIDNEALILSAICGKFRSISNTIVKDEESINIL